MNDKPTPETDLFKAEKLAIRYCEQRGFATKRYKEIAAGAFCTGFNLGEKGANQWQPIETAPKDGVVFLVFSYHDQGGYQYTATTTTDGEIICMMSMEVMVDKPTHWQPLPNPPTP